MTNYILENLPDEILLQILGYLEPYSISLLQLVSRKLQKLCLDDELWKSHCFDKSAWYEALTQRRLMCKMLFIPPSDPTEVGTELPCGSDSNVLGAKRRNRDGASSERKQQLQDMANWDPAFPNERVSWYSEFIQRQGPTSVNWLQTPRMNDRGVEAIIDTHGVALYNPYDGNDGLGTTLAVAPLEDGSVCLWDVKGTRGRQGGILAKSRSDILFFDGPSEQNKKRSKMIDSSIADRVSVNNHDHRAFFAVQSHLIEVDLNRLDVISRQSFEWSITTMSKVDPGLPLTVGTTLGIHLHDFRARAQVSREVVERLDKQRQHRYDPLKAIFDPTPLAPYASLSQPTPNSILHLPRPGSDSLVSDDIYISGRFKSILHYDRRKFPTIAGTIHSGASLNSMAALPYSFSMTDYELRKQGELSPKQVAFSKKEDGRTLIVGGGYNQKGSLEIYGLNGPTANSSASTRFQNSTLKNRYTAASSTILSVATHGTRIVFSDGSGLIKWFERDGSTECRRLKIGHSEAEDGGTLFGSMPAADDVARKILSMKTKHDDQRPNNDNILFWTGEKLGLVSFTSAPLYKELDFDLKNAAQTAEDEARQHYADQMRKALERTADEVRFLGNFASSS